MIRGGPQIVTGLKLPFWGLSFGAGASFLVVRGGPDPRGPPLDLPLIASILLLATVEKDLAKCVTELEFWNDTLPVLPIPFIDFQVPSAHLEYSYFP